FWAFLGGILIDLLSATPIGTSTIGMILIIFAMQLIRTQVFRINLFLLFIFILTGTFLQQIIAFIIYQSIGMGGGIEDVLQYVTLPTLFYNFIFMIPVYIVMWILHYFADPRGIR
ncbi:MAG: rod shape-determining protein MreD, partial [Aggregatilineales bacterium]